MTHETKYEELLRPRETSEGAPPSCKRAKLGRRLGDLVDEIPGAKLASGEATVFVTGVHHDSRRVSPGDLFVARPGARTSGERFVADAIGRGASAVLVARGASVETNELPRIEVEDVPSALAFASAAVYGHPTFALDVVGVTGTNGKTTTTHLVQACLAAAGERPGIVGTLGYRFGDLDLPSTHTSPEADELARIAAAMHLRGASHLVMEVSSIAVAARRVEAVRFRVAAFLNLTQDHLDYHGTMEAYAEAKARLFVDLGPGAAAINVDDPFGAELVKRLAPRGPAGPSSATVARFSTRVGASIEEADIAPVSVEHAASGISLVARTPAGQLSIRSPLVGAHNVQNLLATVAICWLLDVDLHAAARALSGSIRVPGRLERCDDPARDDVIVLVDYAHTPDALERVLQSVRAFGPGSVRCVFGCGGDRDPKKRPLMGEAVARGADEAFVTNDNPRSEDPRAIAEAILPGLAGGRAAVHVELDRAKAIERAVLEAAPGDVVLVAGKGHEPYQIIGNVTLPFDDRVEAERALGLRRSRKGGA
ncbi:UDP-N-acetylmuramoyl-L-alanyl-D-glutamate--2,6-diaminopimelate ligase [Polyangium spumosum]|uniref:UDP-N-acetylmuramoyl-L-alanyl-D-glutamate--2,6-diaminopimelate ligase n=1 Tax=Polyangium spumosum TaxID=889282 RepID=A0A6N7Q0B3_9BACT|nr:UDP-N-acetylmuramoyl-L-alanyl-D-glutamate--2,6-diaminopimelate ligase [Polyangium spumosum]MRG95975.1 UDP-N-acetylmuramoyl-L-alanyl-D-glutamate--2,6-diaminopimelate ligase [Polyangium spumosum]